MGCAAEREGPVRFNHKITYVCWLTTKQTRAALLRKYSTGRNARGARRRRTLERASVKTRTLVRSAHGKVRGLSGTRAYWPTEQMNVRSLPATTRAASDKTRVFAARGDRQQRNPRRLAEPKRKPRRLRGAKTMRLPKPRKMTTRLRSAAPEFGINPMKARCLGVFQGEGRWQCPLFHALRTQFGPRLRSEKGQQATCLTKDREKFQAIAYSVSAAICRSNQARSLFQPTLSGESFTRRSMTAFPSRSAANAFSRSFDRRYTPARYS
jgi:hypothetical protein